MRKTLYLTFIFLFIYLPFSFSQENLNSINSVAEQAVTADVQDYENQEINQDEGYGADDEEYYGSEGNSDQSNSLEERVPLNEMFKTD